jgi:uncharacterized protein
VAWGNSAPLALAGFATTAFMLSMINANLVNSGVLPVVFGVAFAFGGLAQLIAGVIQLRMGNTFGGMLFTGYGAFWLSLFAIGNLFFKAVPLTQVGYALGLFLFAFGIFTVIMLAASFRTSITVVTTLFLLAVTFFLLGAGNYTAAVPTPGGIRAHQDRRLDRPGGGGRRVLPGARRGVRGKLWPRDPAARAARQEVSTRRLIT